MQKLTKAQLDELYECRMFIFVETEPQSNVYTKVACNDKSYRYLTKCVSQYTDAADRKDTDPVFVLPDLPSVS